MEALRDLDQIAYIRFASVYKSFTDLDELRREMEKLAALEPEAARQAR
jgi:transcriptional repressor NrdR